MATIMVTTDFSKRARPALNHALKMASQLKKCKIVVVYVIEHRMANPLYAHYEMPEISPADAMVQLKKWLGAAASKVTPKVVKTQNVAKGIIKTATDLKADYIVMGTHGHGAWGSLFIGSITQKVTAQSKIPVIVV